MSRLSMIRVGLLLPAFVGMLCACIASNPAAEMNAIGVQVIHHSAHCGPTAGAVWIDRPEDLSLPSQFSPGSGSAQTMQWDVASHGALWISMGRRPTGGYRLALMRPTVPVRNGTADIQVQWRRPPAGVLLPQVITAPCLVLKVPKSGIRTLRVIDQDNQTRFTVVVSDSSVPNR
ncbi:MAG: protease complex subunit PrcB family protein [Desulfatitalea sp.]|nr:protease complex subunit PrcB family protein [Desulfatitalea sp.]NNK02810.1 protease complex subunit PrcB family protein [Desulfatitalea sp.]